MATRISELTFSGSLTPDTLFLVEMVDSGTLSTFKATGQQVLDFVGTNSGTSSGGGSGFDSVTSGIAYDALHTAWAGTDAANAAWGYAGQAWTIATAGTNAAHAAASLAIQALLSSWNGTNAAHEADMWARDAYSL